MKNTDLVKFYSKVTLAYRWKILLLFIFPTIWCAAEAIAPYLIKIIIDDLSIGVPSDSSFFEVLEKPILYYFILIVIIEIAIRTCNYVWLKFIPELRADFRSAILDNILKRPISFYQNHLIGDLVTKFKNLSNSFDIMLASFLYGVFPVFASSLIILGFLFYIDKLFALFFLLWFLGMNIVTFYFADKNINLSDKHAANENLLLGHFGDLFRNIISIKIFQSNEIDSKITEKLQTSEIESARSLEWITFKIDAIRSIISILVFLSMIVILAWGWRVGRITLGDFSFVTATCFYIRRSVWVASVNLLNLFKEIGIAKEAINSLVTHDNLDIQLDSKIKNNNFDIKINSIYFGYDDNCFLFEKFNLNFLEGQNTLIIGSSGSGKTTLMRLIMNLLSIQQGSISIGNVSFDKATKVNCKDIVYIPQHNELFHRSIIDNILYGNPNASQEDVKIAASLVQIDKFILGLNKGYYTLVGENGVKLSGGQCQRIIMARALLKKPEILILDEATSALDNDMEKVILKSIMRKTKIRTMIMVSHNHTNLNLFDRVVVLENGAVKDDYLI